MRDGLDGGAPRSPARLARSRSCPRGWNARGAIATIGVAYVDSEEAREALRGAHALARRAGATLRVLTVVEPGPACYAETEPRTAARPGKDVTAVEGEARVEAEQALRAAVAELGDDVAVGGRRVHRRSRRDAHRRCRSASTCSSAARAATARSGR